MLIPPYCDTVPPRVTWRTPIAHVPAVAPPAAGRGALAGVVTERGSGRALSDAVVSLLSPDARLPLARSDSAGGFGAADVAPGEYTLEVRRIGYRMDARPLSVRSGRLDTVRVELASQSCVGY